MQPIAMRRLGLSLQFCERVRVAQIEHFTHPVGVHLLRWHDLIAKARRGV